MNVKKEKKKAARISKFIYPRKGGLTPDEMKAGVELDEYYGQGMPQTRADCVDGPRPCVYVRCRYNLYLDVRRTGSTDKTTICINFPDKDPTEMEHSCALDTVDEHPDGVLFDALSDRLNVCRERARQLEEGALKKLIRKSRSNPSLVQLAETWEDIGQKDDSPTAYHRNRR